MGRCPEEARLLGSSEPMCRAWEPCGVVCLAWQKSPQANAYSPATLQSLKIAVGAFSGFSEQLPWALIQARSHRHTHADAHTCNAYTCMHTC